MNTECDTALSDINLDHLVKIAVDTDWATTVHLDSVIGHMADPGTIATFDRTTDSLEAIRNKIDALNDLAQSDILNDATPFAGGNIDAAVSSRSTLTQAQILNDATPFPGANIDTTISSRSDFDETADQVTVVTNNDKTGYSLSASGIDSILDEVVEGTLTLRQILKIALSALAGKSAGGGTATLTFRDNADSQNVITATVDANGNRTAVTLNPP